MSLNCRTPFYGGQPGIIRIGSIPKLYNFPSQSQEVIHEDLAKILQGFFGDYASL